MVVGITLKDLVWKKKRGGAFDAKRDSGIDPMMAWIYDLVQQSAESKVDPGTWDFLGAFRCSVREGE